MVLESVALWTDIDVVKMKTCNAHGEKRKKYHTIESFDYTVHWCARQALAISQKGWGSWANCVSLQLSMIAISWMLHVACDAGNWTDEKLLGNSFVSIFREGRESVSVCLSVTPTWKFMDKWMLRSWPSIVRQPSNSNWLISHHILFCWVVTAVYSLWYKPFKIWIWMILMSWRSRKLFELFDIFTFLHCLAFLISCYASNKTRIFQRCNFKLFKTFVFLKKISISQSKNAKSCD